MTVTPKVKIQILCECPNCNLKINLFKSPYFNGIVWNFFEHWISYKKTYTLEFKCENCTKTFYVQDVVMIDD